MDDTEAEIIYKEPNNLYGEIPDARPVQREFSSRFPLSGLDRIKFRNEGRSHPSATPESVFPYYFNNYEVSRLHLTSLQEELGRPIRVLEIGCGTGWGSRLLADSLPDSSFVATNRIEGSKDRQILQRARADFQSGNLKFEEADATRLREIYEEESFDAVVMLEVIEHIPQNLHDNIAQQVSEILKPKGAFLISTPSSEGYGIITSAPQSKDHVWVFGNRQDISNALSPHFNDVTVDRITNGVHITTFGKNTIKQHLLSVGAVRAPETMFTQYVYEKGDVLTDIKHQQEKDTHTWFAVARKA